MKKISDLKNLNYQDFIETSLELLIDFCKDNELKDELVQHLSSTDLDLELHQALAKIMDNKINTILNERT